MARVLVVSKQKFGTLRTVPPTACITFRTSTVTPILLLDFAIVVARSLGVYIVTVIAIHHWVCCGHHLVHLPEHDLPITTMLHVLVVDALVSELLCLLVEGIAQRFPFVIITEVSVPRPAHTTKFWQHDVIFRNRGLNHFDDLEWEIGNDNWLVSKQLIASFHEPRKWCAKCFILGAEIVNQPVHNRIGECCFG